MPRTNTNVFEQHVEKIALAIGAAALLTSVTFFLILSPYKSEDGFGPRDIANHASEVALDVARKIQTKRLPDPESIPQSGQLQRWFADSAEGGLIKIADLQPAYTPIQGWPPPLVDMLGTAEEDKHDLAVLLPPEKPIVRTGRSKFQLRTPPPLEQLGTPSGAPAEAVQKNWALVIAQIDLLEQGRLFRRSQYAMGKYNLPILALHLQRRNAYDPAAAWEDVTVYRPYAHIELPELEFTPDARLNTQSTFALTRFRQVIKAYENWIARAPLPDPVGGDPIVYPEVPWLWGDPYSEEQERPRGILPGEGPDRRTREPVHIRRFRQWLKAGEEELRKRDPDLDLAAILLEAALGEEGIEDAMRDQALPRWRELDQLRQRAGLPPLTQRFRRPEKLMPVMAADLDLLPARPYVFRVRYEILNHYLGEPTELRNPDDARKFTLLSPWSPPSAVVEIKTDLYLFLVSVEPDKNSATFRVFRERGRRWLVERFTVQVGEQIGEAKRGGPNRGVDFSTNAVLVDVVAPDARPDAFGVILVDTADGRLERRTVEGDNNDRKHQELQDQARRDVAQR
jgi:hypothetical protein